MVKQQKCIIYTGNREMDIISVIGSFRVARMPKVQYQMSAWAIMTMISKFIRNFFLESELQ